MAKSFTTQELIEDCERQIKAREENREIYKYDPDQVFAFNHQIDCLKFMIGRLKIIEKHGIAK